MRDKDKIEKTRINNRVGYESKGIDVKMLIH
jgi:hypothetical protein